MRISSESKELAALKYHERANQINDSHDYSINHVRRTTASEFHRQSAIDRDNLARARELAEAWLEIHLDAFQEEGLLPDASDLNEVGKAIEKIIKKSHSQKA